MENFIKFVKVILAIVASILAIATAAGLWNAATDGNVPGFYVVASILNLAMEGIGIYWFSKNVLFREENNGK